MARIRHTYNAEDRKLGLAYIKDCKGDINRAARITRIHPSTLKTWQRLADLGNITEEGEITEGYREHVRDRKEELKANRPARQTRHARQATPRAALCERVAELDDGRWLIRCDDGRHSIVSWL